MEQLHRSVAGVALQGTRMVSEVFWNWDWLEIKRLEIKSTPSKGSYWHKLTQNISEISGPFLFSCFSLGNKYQKSDILSISWYLLFSFDFIYCSERRLCTILHACFWHPAGIAEADRRPGGSPAVGTRLWIQAWNQTSPKELMPAWAVKPKHVRVTWCQPLPVPLAMGAAALWSPWVQGRAGSHSPEGRAPAGCMVWLTLQTSWVACQELHTYLWAGGTELWGCCTGSNVLIVLEGIALPHGVMVRGWARSHTPGSNTGLSHP